MSTGMDAAVYVVLAVAILGVVWAILTLNGFVRARNLVDESWSGVDVQLKRRHDLVPNLIETVKAYAEHERVVLRAVTEARETAACSSGRRGRQGAEYDLSEAIANVRVMAERYPDLRAAEAFR